MLWGWARPIPWWNALRWHPSVLLAALAGASLALAGWNSPLRAGRAQMAELFCPLSGPTLGALALLSGLAEEALFRGVLLAEIGVVLSCLLFALLHLGTPYAAAWSLVVALGLAGLYLASGNLLLCVSLHACSNLITFGLLKRGVTRPSC